MKVQFLVSALAAAFAITASAAPAWSYRWGGYNSFGNGWGSGNGVNYLRYILPVNAYRGNYNYGSNNGYNNYSRGYNCYNACYRHHRRWW